MSRWNSATKVIGCLAAVAKEDVTLAGRLLPRPHMVAVTDSFWRRYDCLPHCGGCCLAFSLDFLPAEWQTFAAAYPDLAGLGQERLLVVNGQSRPIVTIRQPAGRWCRFLTAEARCGVYPARPLSCRTELIKLRRVEGDGYIFKGPYPRARLMAATDGGPIRCDFADFDRTQLFDNDIPVLEQLNDWADYLGVATWLPEIITALRAVYFRPLTLRFFNAEQTPPGDP